MSGNGVKRNKPPGKIILRDRGPGSGSRNSGKTFHLLKSSSKTPGSIPVPDTWILFRDLNLKEKNIGLPQGCRLEEYPVSVKIF